MACSDDGDTTGASSSATASTTTSPGSSSGDSSSAGDPTTTGGTTGGTTDAATTGADTTTADTSGSETTSSGPPSGPGVFPGESGMDAFCRRYKECGGTYYDDAQACLDATYDYWGDCPSRKTALDAFGACMSEMACADWSPDAYNPASTPCAAEWDEVGASEPCP